VPKTHAQRQRDYRNRQNAATRHEAQRITELEAALEARIAALEAERDRLQADLDAALTECERLAAIACKHPVHGLFPQEEAARTARTSRRDLNTLR
jgi:hypothetical protein